MVVEIQRDNRIITIVPDNIMHMVSSPYNKETPWGCVMSSGDIVYLNEEEKLGVDAALRLRDEQIEQLLKDTATIIGELNSINSNTVTTASNTASTASNTSQILSQERSNGTLLSQIKTVCDNILSWIRSN